MDSGLAFAHMGVVCAAASFVAMISGGFWGLGGGWLIVPALLLAGVDFQTAVAASLLQMAPSAFVTVVGQVRKIGWSKGSWGMKVALPLCAATFIGSFFGSPLGHFLEWLFGGTRKPHEILYIGLLVWIIWETLTRRNKNQSPYSEPPPDLKMAGPCAAGFGIGAIAAMLGVGGGIQTRPLLANVLQVPEGITAMITRLAIFLTATAGSISYLCDASVKKGAVVSMALCLMAGGIVGFRVGAWMHSVVLKAGGAAKAGGSFALVAFAVLLGMVCKTTGLIMAGRCLILLAGISLTAYLVFETVKAKRVVKELGSEEGNAT